MTIYGVAGTYAEKYAGEKGIKFVAIVKKLRKFLWINLKLQLMKVKTVQLHSLR